MHDEMFKETMRRCQQAISEAQFAVDMLMLGDLKMDEVSLLFRNSGDLDSFLEQAIGFGGDHFNGVAQDRMVRLDGTSQFDVRFEFMRMPDCDWRIEMMTILDGKAELHEERLAALDDEAVVFHVSYKLDGEEAYETHCDAMSTGGRLGAIYQNSYGRFSYYGQPPHPYLKPRVNLRDT